MRLNIRDEAKLDVDVDDAKPCKCYYVRSDQISCGRVLERQEGRYLI